MSYDSWLTTPPPMESAPDPEEDEPEDNTGPSDDGSDDIRADLPEYRACPYCGEDDRMRCACDGLEF